MALKDKWVDRTNDEDFVLAEDINNVANAVIALEDKIENGVSITVDDALSETSENPVQNKVITQVVAEAGAAIEIMVTRMPPDVTVADDGKFLQVVDGTWQAVALTDVSVEGA
jgi:hypothetical protein